MSDSPEYFSARAFVLAALVAIGALVLGFVGFRVAPQLLTEDPSSRNVVTITATGLDFDAPNEISSGWTTLRFNNESGMTHFALLERLPDGIGVEEHQAEVAPLFQKGFELMAAGKPDSASQTFEALPEWFSGVVFLGGPGLVAPGRTAQATVNLEPGTYLIECYVKTNGVFHSYNPLPDTYGMVREITVAEEASGTTAPEPSVELDVSKEAGIVWMDDRPVPPGQHTVAVHFRDQAVYKNFVGHDVHLVRLGPGTDEAAVAAWMDWTRADGLETPAPASFVGGTNEVPAGDTVYFTVDLSPGQYAWIAEVPNPAEKGMLKTFTVPSGGEISTHEGN
jgi:uncharacterized cupredoxin-like copper-binding protein